MKYISWLFIVIGLVILGFIFGSPVKQEVNYQLDQMAHVKYVVDGEQVNTFEKPLVPPNTDFSILIPKIGAAASIVDGVDPTDSVAYLKALKKGVAHAAGTTYPGQIGNFYLFAHSTDALVNVGRYNAVFFLIGKLQPGDEIDVYFQGNLYKYTVYDKKVVSPDDSYYLGTLIDGEKTLTLQTCYPPGTTLKRLVVLAKIDK